MNWKLAAYTCVLLTPAVNSHAGCKYLGEAIQYEVKQYKSFQEQEMQIISGLTGTEARCRQFGAELSTKVATLTQGDSCHVLAEISELNSKLTTMGKSCTDTFSKIQNVQSEVQAKFDLVMEDIDEAYKFMQESSILQEACGEQIRDTKKLREAFFGMSPQVRATSTKAAASTTDYSQFTRVTDTFRQLAGNRGQRCGWSEAQMAGLKAPASGAKAIAAAAAAPVPVPRGKSENPESQITGRINGESLSSQAPAKKVAAVKFRQAGKDFERSYWEGKLGAAPGAQEAKGEAVPAYSRSPASVPVASSGSVGSSLWQEDASGRSEGLVLKQEASPSEQPLENELGAAEKAGELQSSDLAIGLESPGRAPASNGVRFLGEIASVSYPSLNADDNESLFSRVRRAYSNTEIYRAEARVVVSANSR